jgi:ubiquinone/menaquinone biosynthesis C-methylase UbiE
MTAAAVNNPFFARWFNRVIPLMERDAGAHRRDMLAGATGRVVEIGAGNGISFRHYPATVEEVVALEPEPYLRARAEEAAREAAVPVTVRDAVAEDLPFEPCVFDSAVASLVLCSVADPERVLTELRRVLKPGGQLRFFEHVRSDDPTKARVQTWVDRSGVWARLGGGCHCARDTVGSIQAAGFDVRRVRPIALGPSWLVTTPYVMGLAT